MWIKKNVDNLIYYTLPKWEKLGVKIVMTTRHGGVSSVPFESLNLGLHVDDSVACVLENRSRVMSLFNSDMTHLVAANQTHGVNIQVVNSGHMGLGSISMGNALADTDGIVSDDSNIVMSMHYADCLPVMVFDFEHQAVGIGHSGWRGTLSGIAMKLVDTMSEVYGSDRSKLLAATGPSIGSCCYEVDNKFYDSFINRYDNAVGWFVSIGTDKYKFDIKKANYDQLVGAGVKSANISILDVCTGCNHADFFSYRYEHGITGRMGLYAKLGV